MKMIISQFDYDYYETLRWVNKFRRVLGLGPLPRLVNGKPRMAETCPVALSIALGSDYDVRIDYLHVRVRHWKKSKEFLCPYHNQNVNRFIRKFDREDYSLLIK